MSVAVDESQQPFASTGEVVICQVGTIRCAVPLRVVDETLRPLPVRPVANPPDFVMGLSIIRGCPTPVVHVGRLLGVGTAPPARLLTIRIGARKVALALDGVLGVGSIGKQLGALPPLLQGALTDRVSELGVLDSELLLLLNETRIIPDPLWDTLEDSIS